MPTRPIIISRSENGQTVAALLHAHLSLSWNAARRLVLERRVRLNGVACPDPNRRVQRGQRLEVLAKTQRTEPSRERVPSWPEDVPRPAIRFADAHVVVVEKPAGLTTVRHREEAAEFGARARRYLPPTLADLLPALLAARSGSPVRHLRAVHRLDKETSGLVVFARTPEAESNLGKQFRAHTTDRLYLALVRGEAQAGRIESYLAADRGDGRRGSTTRSGEGQHAVTHVRVVERLGGYTLVECRLETGRTHQVRIHLGEAGTPLCGDHIYDRPLHGRPFPDGSQAPRIALHAATLGFDHPATGTRVDWSSPLPQDLAALLKRLRRGK